jgi:hypothetical protein
MSDKGVRRWSQSVSLQDTFSIAQPRMRWGSSTLLCKVFICDAARVHCIRVLICCYRDVYSFNSQCVFTSLVSVINPGILRPGGRARTSRSPRHSFMSNKKYHPPTGSLLNLHILSPPSTLTHSYLVFLSIS